MPAHQAPDEEQQPLIAKSQALQYTLGVGVEWKCPLGQGQFAMVFPLVSVVTWLLSSLQDPEPTTGTFGSAAVPVNTAPAVSQLSGFSPWQFPSPQLLPSPPLHPSPPRHRLRPRYRLPHALWCRLCHWQRRGDLIRVNQGECAESPDDMGSQALYNVFPPNAGFAHTQTTHPNNMIYLSPEDERKPWLYAVVLTLSFQDLGF